MVRQNNSRGSDEVETSLPVGRQTHFIAVEGACSPLLRYDLNPADFLQGFLLTFLGACLSVVNLQGFLYLHMNQNCYFMILPYCVYVLQSQKDLLLYHGFTTNIERRIEDHNKGTTTSTSKRRPLKIVHCEMYLSKKDALRREKYFKTTRGKRMLKLMLRETLIKINYPKKSYVVSRKSE